MEFLRTSSLVFPLLSLALCILIASATLPPSFLILEAGRHIDLEIDRLLLKELELDVFDADRQGLLPPLNGRFLDALTLSFNRASRSRPAFSLLLGLLTASPKVLAAFLLVLPS